MKARAGARKRCAVPRLPCSSLALNRRFRNALRIVLTPAACSRSPPPAPAPVSCPCPLPTLQQDINQFVLEAGPAIANSESTVRRIVSTTTARLDVRARSWLAELWCACCDAPLALAGAVGSCFKSRLRPQHQRQQLFPQASLLSLRCNASQSLTHAARSFVHGHGGGDVDALLRDAPSMVPSASQAMHAPQ